MQMSVTRTLVPIVPNGDTRKKEEVSKRKQPKSRNGCVTCKAKRMKCDETKPACQQCTRRKVECGGYAQVLRWKPVGKFKDGRKPEEATNVADENLEPGFSTMNLLLPDRSDGTAEDDDNVLLEGLMPLSSHSMGLQRSRSSPDSGLPMPLVTNLNQGSIPSQGSIELPDAQYTSEVMYDNLNATYFGPVQQDGTLLPTCSPTHSLNLTDLDLFLVENALNLPTHDQQSPQMVDLLRSPFNTSLNQYGGISWSPYHPEPEIDMMDALNEGLAEDASTLDISDHGIQPLENCPPLFNLQVITDLLQSYQHSQPPGLVQDRIRQAFEIHTSKVLSIKDDDAPNPWMTLIWPMAFQYPALYHALAAMTCLHLCRIRPELRSHGLKHFRYSVQMLETDADGGNIPLESMLASRLALGLAEGFDYRQSATGIHQLDIAGELVQQAISNHQNSQLGAEELERMSFLANTWMYLDVMAHFTCPDWERSIDLDLFTDCSLLNPVPREQQIDCLMGCAVTLFPLLGRLQDLIVRVRKRPEKRNSPAIISKAIDLWITIEKWNPPIDVEKFEANSGGIMGSNVISDSIQTAEAYRWSALIMLRQAVPELPWSHSVWELAQKALVFLATVPLSSRTTLMHIFPLLCAGTESLDEEDRDWVRDRWKLMSQRMITGIVDRCNSVTVEVWRRRDEHMMVNPFCRSSATTGKCRFGLHTKSSMLSATMPKDFTTRCTCDTSPDARAASSSPPSSDFPESVAFKKNIDPLTRGGSIRYTVKGDLHWLGVMKDWGWQG